MVALAERAALQTSHWSRTVMRTQPGVLPQMRARRPRLLLRLCFMVLGASDGPCRSLTHLGHEGALAGA